MPPDRFVELAEVAGSFIHEIKNHLGTLGLNLQLLAEDFQGARSPRERRALERVRRLQGECQRLIDVSNDFLRFAKAVEPKLAPADLGQVVEEMVDFFGPSARQSNLDIRCYLPADLPPVRLDRDLFKQALLNLLLNAQQAQPGGGELVLQASVEAVPDGRPGVCLSVIDTGAGMTPDVLDRAFRPFYSTKTGGTGLGLPTARKIVEAHGGSLEAQSEPGRGTKFTIRLPADDGAPR